MIPSWLAPNVELATPRVEKYAKRITNYLNAVMVDFWAAVPTHHDVEDRQGNRWTEAWYCLQLKGQVYVPMSKINTWRKTIDCFHVEYDPADNTTNVLLSARILR